MTTLLETVSESEGPNLLMENMWFGNCGSNSSAVHGNLPLCPWLKILSNYIGERNPPKHHRVMRLLTLLSPLNSGCHVPRHGWFFSSWCWMRPKVGHQWDGIGSDDILLLNCAGWLVSSICLWHNDFILFMSHSHVLETWAFASDIGF